MAEFAFGAEVAVAVVVAVVVVVAVAVVVAVVVDDSGLNFVIEKSLLLRKANLTDQQ